MEPSKTYHLYTHANGFENLFRSQENYRYFLSKYEHFIPSVADTLAYCLMPNHVHFLIRIKGEKEIRTAYPQSSKVYKPTQTNLGGFDQVEKRISQQFSNLLNAYTKAFNKMYGRRGSLFIPNFKRDEVTSDEYFTRVICYIHRNPFHHGFTNSFSDWPWSSYGLIIDDTPTFVMTKEVLKWFGNSEEFKKMHQQSVIAFGGA